MMDTSAKLQLKPGVNHADVCLGFYFCTSELAKDVFLACLFPIPVKIIKKCQGIRSKTNNNHDINE